LSSGGNHSLLLGVATIASVADGAVSHSSQATVLSGRSIFNDLTEVLRQSVAEPGQLNVLG
jgi:hypothetical protein